ncbi:aspartate-semialdehyde dehydrogenase [Pseudomonas sp. CFBP 8758]|uniref:aspartate-semialdehyde dehydrogenase n=1 Tax=Pseudomonas sp. CFBP 8758 TaxID=2775286 RepID=UPI001786D2D1|nr:aspartate-semialdehyde dehydrogenase [Pseudomonas sp. CFBP 8758]MBD8592998.1 aspartate-semialdehyde dehydrogenase [Pseudomonas sp. CFBP 8758]
MIPPLIPISVVPVTSQLDPVKSTPSIAPVAPAQPGSNETAIDLRHHDADQTALLLREEQRRRQREGRQPDPDEHTPVPGDSLNADKTVPVAPLVEDPPRQGLWVDIQV